MAERTEPRGGGEAADRANGLTGLHVFRSLKFGSAVVEPARVRTDACPVRH